MRSLLAKYGLENRYSEAFASLMGELGARLSFSLRDIECAVVLYSLAQPADGSAVFLSWPIALKIKRPSLFQRLLQGDMRAHKEAHKLAGGMAAEFSRRRTSSSQSLPSTRTTTAAARMLFPKPLTGRYLRLTATMTADRFFPWLFARVDLAVNV